MTCPAPWEEPDLGETVPKALQWTSHTALGRSGNVTAAATQRAVAAPVKIADSHHESHPDFRSEGRR